MKQWAILDGFSHTRKKETFWNVDTTSHDSSSGDYSALAEMCHGMKWRLKKWKMEDEEKKAFPRIWFLKKQTGLSRERNSLSWKAWSCRRATCEAINACWHLAKNVQILSELRPKKLLVPSTNQHGFDWRLWELCLCIHWAENWALQVNSGGFYPQQAVHQGFFDGENVRVFEIVTWVNEKSCSIFIVVVHGPFQ